MTNLPLMRLLFTVGALLLVLSNCKGPCRQLSERLCECAINSTEKTNCVQRAGNEEGKVAADPVIEQNCRNLLASCDCRLIDTPRGKINCGLARDPDAGF